MTLPAWARKDILLVSRETEGLDDFGDPGKVQVSHLVEGCFVQFLSATERDTQATLTAKVFAPIDADLIASDTVEVSLGGRVRLFTVFGQPELHRGASRRLDHLTASLKEVDRG